MLRMDRVHVIRHKVLIEGRSQRSVAREMGVSRNTVRKYVEESEPRRREPGQRARRVLERVIPRLKELLEEWTKRTTRKQRLTGTRLHRQLVEEGFEVGITTVRRYFREWKRQRQETYIPLIHRPGEEAQVDFFEVTVEEEGVAHRVWKFLLHLPYSGRSFVWLYDRADRVSFLDGHVRAFAFLGGVPLRCIYDNLSAAVRRRVGSERTLTDRFQALVSHYLFEACFARPGEGHDKGSVESRGKGLRLAHLTPVPRGKNLSEISTAALESVDSAWRSKEPSKWEEEVRGLLELPQSAFDPRLPEVVRVSRQATVQAGGSTYSVPSRWKCLQITALIGIEEITFQCREEEVRRTRVRRGKRAIQYSDYFEELSRKPQAVRQVAPELLEELGEPYQKLWKMLDSRYGALETARLFAKLLAAVIDHGSEEVAAALEEALAAGRFDLLSLEPAVEPATVDVPEGLEEHDVECARAADFDVLLEGSVS
jgi:transposase